MTLRPDGVTVDCANPQLLGEFWAKVLNVSIAGDYGDFLMLTPQTEHSGRIAFQKVPENLAGKNRLHLDFSSDNRAADVARVCELGAKAVEEHTQPGIQWTVLTDPEENVFCIGEHHN